MPGRRVAPRASLLALCLAGGLLRFATLGNQSFWLDEAATGRLVRLGLGGMLRAVPDGESTPPLYYVIAWLWTRVFGTGEVGLRSLSAVFGTLTIPLLYAAASRAFGRRAGLMAAGLAAFSPLLIWYSQEARSYALLVALCAASLWALGRAVESSPGWLAVWAAACALALASHYFAAFVIAPQCVWLHRVRGRAALPALGGVLFAGAALAPLALHQRAHGGAGFIAASPLGTRLLQAAKQLVVGYDAPGQIPLTLIGGLLALGLAGLAIARAQGPSWRLAAVAAAGVGVPLALALLGVDYLITRNLLGAWVPAALAVSVSGAGSGGRLGPALVAGLCAVGLVVTLGQARDGRYQRDDWRAAAATLPARVPTAVVVTPASGGVALGYYRPAARAFPASGAAVAEIEVIGLGVRGVGAPAQALPLAAPAPSPAGFAAPTARREATFSVRVYRALGPPVLVTPAMLASLVLIKLTPSTLLLRSG